MAMDDDLSKTMRIDLIPDDGAPDAAGPKARMSSLTRMNWTATAARKVPAYAAKSNYHKLLQSLYDAALVTTLNGQIKDVNVRATEFLQYERKELRELTVSHIISGVSEQLIETLLTNLENERFTLLQAYCVRKDRTFFPAEIAVNKLQLEEPLLCFFIRDITVRRQAEERLRTEHKAIQISGNGIATADLDARLDYVNPAFATMLGHAETEPLLGRDIRDFINDKAAADEIIEKVKEDPRTWMSEMSMKKEDGDDLFVQVSATCNRSSEGEALGIVFSFADITDYKQAQKRLDTMQMEIEAKVAERTSGLIKHSQELEAELAKLKAAQE
jgi:PAS domain S-box-containing protein